MSFAKSTDNSGNSCNMQVNVLYNDRQDFNFENIQLHGLKARICIPFERSQQQNTQDNHR
jgi:hypothetical protein